MAFDAKKLINILNDNNVNKSNIAKSNKIILQELNNNLNDTYNLVEGLSIEKSIKYILWNGLLNQYGIYGRKRELPREFGKRPKRIYSTESYSRGKVLSIDFGISNIGRELSLTHSGIVIADYNGMVIVIPITSQKEFGLTKLSPDIQKSTIPLLHSEYPDIETDSYVLIHQIRAVSKNRITKVITSLSKTKIMQDIEKKLFETQTPYMKKIYNDKIKKLENKIKKLEKALEEK
ncbi:type II toxin-antitoxin system PemK/MazF family toxin [Clostridium sp. VAP52]|uniref:type II toxin-antitoxin system PemK/MazF family toxin n=1 Tax=Clostridium sp. VAP52 TaxID=2949977 RepID=UPI002079D3AE|nr:type II toxin-antitoxin system PemK/MazF family toxin [Clostridium sp. VAP52]